MDSKIYQIPLFILQTNSTVLHYSEALASAHLLPSHRFFNAEQYTHADKLALTFKNRASYI
jgi:hypothetical protein